jgi:transposase-like protein
MITQVLHCPYCQGIDIVRHGKSPEGKQRYRCRQCREGSGCTFLLDYTYAGQSPEVKQPIVDMANKALRPFSKDVYGWVFCAKNWQLPLTARGLVPWMHAIQ